MKQAYIAGPLFDDHEREYLVKIAEIVESFGFNTFLPHRAAGLVTEDFTFEKKLSSTKYIGKKSNNDLVKYNLRNIMWKYCGVVKNKELLSIGLQKIRTIKNHLIYK